MTLQVGRIPAIAEPMDWQNSGDQVTIAGRIAAGSALAATQLREQLLGYHQNLDEPIIPIISSVDPRLTGFYQVGSVHVPTNPPMFLTQGVIEYTIQAQRIPGFGAPVVETTVLGGLVPNAYSVLVATVQPWACRPAATTGWYVQNPTQLVDRIAEDGTVKVQTFSPTTAPGFAQLLRMVVPAASFYQSAAQIQGGLLTTPYAVVGRQMQVAKNDWRLTNGLIRVQSGASNTGFGISFYTGAAWGAVKQFTFNPINAGTIAEDATVRILRNAPEEVIIRLAFLPSNVIYGPIFVDLTLRRGSRVLNVYLTVLSFDTWQLNGPNVAQTVLTAGAKQTAADGDGNKLVVMTSGSAGGPVGFPTSPVAVWPTTSATTFDYGVGAEVGTTAAGNNAQDLIYQYLAAQGEKQHVVIR